MDRMTAREVQEYFRATLPQSTQGSKAQSKARQDEQKGQKRQNLVMTEHEEQKKLMEHCKLMQRKYPELALLYAIPNGGQRHLFVAVKLKAEGVKRGIPDLDLPVPRGNYHGLRIEMKRLKGGCESESQKWWRERLTEQGYYCVVCRGWEAAWKAIEGYLKLGRFICS